MPGKFQDYARRQNARKSTGPKTAQGKANSRVNSTKHGLTGSGIVLPPEMRQMYEERRYHLGAKVDRLDRHSEKLEQEFVLASVRMDASRIALRRRVDNHWDAERELAVLALARELGERPEETTLRLEMTSQGVAWKLERLRFLAETLQERRSWTNEQKQLAFDLLGVPRIERQAYDDISDIDDCIAVLADERERLEALKADVLDPEDESARLEAQIGVPHDDSREARLYRRYESESWRKYEKLSDKLKMRVRRGDPPPKPQPPLYETFLAAKSPAATPPPPPPAPPPPPPPPPMPGVPVAPRRDLPTKAPINPVTGMPDTAEFMRQRRDATNARSRELREGGRVELRDEAGDPPCRLEGSRGPQGRNEEVRPLKRRGRPVR